MNAFAVFEDGHIEKIDSWHEFDTGDVEFWIGTDRYFYQEFIATLDNGIHYKNHVFVKVNYADSTPIIVPIKEITVPKTYKFGPIRRS